MNCKYYSDIFLDRSNQHEKREGRVRVHASLGAAMPPRWPRSRSAAGSIYRGTRIKRTMGDFSAGCRVPRENNRLSLLSVGEQATGGGFSAGEQAAREQTVIDVIQRENRRRERFGQSFLSTAPKRIRKAMTAIGIEKNSVSGTNCFSGIWE